MVSIDVYEPIPVLALTTSIAKSGEYPVRPKIVVLMYFVWPQRSINVISFVDCSHISSVDLDSL